jgi:hypothetical protein
MKRSVVRLRDEAVQFFVWHYWVKSIPFTNDDCGDEYNPHFAIGSLLYVMRIFDCFIGLFGKLKMFACPEGSLRAWSIVYAKAALSAYATMLC